MSYFEFLPCMLRVNFCYFCIYSRRQIDDVFFLLLPESRLGKFMQILSLEDKLHEISMGK